MIMKTVQFLENKNTKPNNSTNLDDQVFESMDAITLLKHDYEPRARFMNFYHSQNQLFSNKHDDYFYEDFKAFLEKNI